MAAAFNRLSHYPDDATVEFDYGFEIGAVIAIAPVYGQYRPGGRLTALTDVNYMSIHGAHDGDVTQFDGARQFQNVRFTGNDYRFKTTAYVFGANHGQFNTVWGDNDWGMPFGNMLNRRALISGHEQRQAGKVFMSAFLEASLNGRPEYLELFIDPRRGAEWLPETIYITDFEDSRSRILVDFDEDVDVTTATIAGGSTYGENLSVWREDRLQFKYRDKETSAAYLGWYTEPDEEEEHGEEATEHDDGADDSHAHARESLAESTGPARYLIELLAGFDPGQATELFLAVTDANESPEPDEDDDSDESQDQDAQQGHDEDQQQQGHDSDSHAESSDNEDGEDTQEDEDEPREPLDFTLRLTDVAGNQAALPLSRFSLVQPQLEVQIRKGIFAQADKESEAIPQRFTFPFAWFTEANPGFDPTSLRTIELLFDRTDKGVIALDRVGIR